MRSWICVAFIVVTLIAAGAGPARGEDGQEPHVRTISPLAQRLVADATERSPAFKALVDAVNASDVVVYVSLDMRLSERVRGQLQFIGSAGGRRYLDVRVARHLDRRIEMAALAHELQHAVEIAGAPEVVDSATLDRFYRRIGFSISDRFWHESHAAMAAGDAVMRELTHAPAAAADAGVDEGRK